MEDANKSVQTRFNKYHQNLLALKRIFGAMKKIVNIGILARRIGS